MKKSYTLALFLLAILGAVSSQVQAQAKRKAPLVGGAAGAGSLAIKGSKELKIESGTEMLLHVTR